jgi:hypothetical protein
MKTKAYNCVADKDRAQTELMREFEARRGEFEDYAEFIRRAAEERALAREVRARIAASHQRHEGSHAPTA